MAKWVYSFGDGRAEGSADMRDLLGGKGANLAEMSNLGLPVPPGFTITTEVCSYFYAHEKQYPDFLEAEIEEALIGMARITGRTFGDAEKPLLVSVRSGARASMPGMMDTVLNLGLNDQTVEALAAEADRRFAYDSYRRFIQMYSDVVLGIDHGLFEERLEDFKDERGVVGDTELDGDDWAELTHDFKSIVQREKGVPFPQEPKDDPRPWVDEVERLVAQMLGLLQVDRRITETDGTTVAVTRVERSSEDRREDLIEDAGGRSMNRFEPRIGKALIEPVEDPLRGCNGMVEFELGDPVNERPGMVPVVELGLGGPDCGEFEEKVEDVVAVIVVIDADRFEHAGEDREHPLMTEHPAGGLAARPRVLRRLRRFIEVDREAREFEAAGRLVDTVGGPLVDQSGAVEEIG